MISFVCAFVVFFIIGYFIKKYIIQSIYTGITVDGELKDRNIITIGYIFDRLKWLFNLKNIKLYVYSFFAKVFYLLVSTATMIIIGLISIVKKFKKISKLNSEQTAFTIFIFLSFILMFFACCINGTGSSENFAYSFYARYFEYTISPIVFIGVYTCLYYRLRMKDIFFTILVCLISGIMTSNIITNLDSNEIHVDVYRIAGFSYGIKKNDNFESLIFYLVILIIFVFVLIFIFNYILKIRTVILLFILIYFFNSNLVCIDTINTINQNSILDLQIAEYINNRENNDLVYFIDDEYRYYGFYSRMQVLMPKIQMKIIQVDQFDQINSDSFIITYKATPSDTILGEIENPLIAGSIFNLYKKQ